MEVPPTHTFRLPGRGPFTIGNCWFEAHAGTFLTSAKGQTHGFKAQDRLILLAFAAPKPAADIQSDLCGENDAAGPHRGNNGHEGEDTLRHRLDLHSLEEQAR